MKKQSSMAGLAGAVALAGASQAYGSVVVATTPTNITGHAPAASDSGTRVNVDLDGNGVSDVSFLYRNLSEPGGAFLLGYVVAGTSTAPGSVVGASISGQAYAYALPSGYSVGPSSTFYQKTGYFGHVVTNYAGTDYGFGKTGTREYVGFRFTGTAGTEYGFVQLEVDPYVSATNPGGIQFFTAQYENTGAAITTGPASVPEPTSLAALAFGGVALAVRRSNLRKRSA